MTNDSLTNHPDITAALAQVGDALDMIKREYRDFCEIAPESFQNADAALSSLLEGLKEREALDQNLESMRQTNAALVKKLQACQPAEPVDVEEGAYAIYYAGPTMRLPANEHGKEIAWVELPEGMRGLCRKRAKACARAWGLQIKEGDHD